MIALCEQVERLSRQLSDLCRRGMGNTNQAQQVARYWDQKLIFLPSLWLLGNNSNSILLNFCSTLSEKLHELKDSIQKEVVNRVVEDFSDINTPLKQFTEAVHVPEGSHFSPKIKN